MTNREMLDRMSNKLLASIFFEKVAQDGGYCAKCPFEKLCVGGECGFEVWLGLECEQK